MSSFVSVGKKLETVDLLDLFPADEGSIDQIYGRIGSGKTYAATADILHRLKRGEVVYANWHIDFSGYDERDSLWFVLLGMVGLKRRFYRFRPENLHYIQITDDFIDNFEKLTDCAVYLDEGHVVFDSYQHAKFSMRKRTAILHTRHFNRTIVIISQRPTAIHVSARANVNRFYKVERLFKWPFLLFRKTEFQDMVDETVDEDAAVSTKLYIGSRSIFKAYNSKYLRNGMPTSQQVYFDAYKVSYIQSWELFFRMFDRLLTLPQPFRARQRRSISVNGLSSSSFPVPITKKSDSLT